MAGTSPRSERHAALFPHHRLEALVPFRHPFTCIVCGPSGSGKTMFTTRLVLHAKEMITPPPETVTWCYGEWQEAYTTLQGVEFIEGLPDVDAFDSSKRRLLIIDDMMSEKDERISKIFTKKSHHRNLSVVYIVQNLFSKSKENRTININSQYMVLFKNPRDASTVTHLARQMYPGNVQYMQEAFSDSTSKPYGYLLVDLKQDTPEHMRLRTNIFPGQFQDVYIRK